MSATMDDLTVKTLLRDLGIQIGAVGWLAATLAVTAAIAVRLTPPSAPFS